MAETWRLARSSHAAMDDCSCSQARLRDLRLKFVSLRNFGAGQSQYGTKDMFPEFGSEDNLA